MLLDCYRATETKQQQKFYSTKRQKGMWVSCAASMAQQCQTNAGAKLVLLHLPPCRKKCFLVGGKQDKLYVVLVTTSMGSIARWFLFLALQMKKYIQCL